MKKAYISFIALLCAVCVMLSPGASFMSPFAAYAADKGGLAETTVEGIPRKIYSSRQSVLERTLTISPAKQPRTVRLQRYNSETGKFRTIKKYETETGKRVKLTVRFPKYYRNRALGKWRIVVDKCEDADKFISRTFKVYTRNIRKLKLNARSACVYCIDTNHSLYAKKMTAKRHMASTTKIMTATVLLESGKLGGKVKISSNAANTPYANLYMSVGDVYKNRDLLYAALLPSSNDAATALSEAVGTTTPKFVDMMNDKAQELGLKKTHYKNPHGLDAEGHYTSARDLTRLMAYIGENEDFIKVIKTSKYSFTSVKKKVKHTVYTTDPMKDIKGHIGGKTGYTRGARQCLVTLYKHGKRTYAVAVLGCTWRATRREDMEKIYSYIDEYGDSVY
jgi:D-alanyl-D-alanine carboxypeptidase